MKHKFLLLAILGIITCTSAFSQTAATAPSKQPVHKFIKPVGKDGASQAAATPAGTSTAVAKGSPHRYIQPVSEKNAAVKQSAASSNNAPATGKATTHRYVQPVSDKDKSQSSDKK